MSDYINACNTPKVNDSLAGSLDGEFSIEEMDTVYDKLKIINHQGGMD